MDGWMEREKNHPQTDEVFCHKKEKQTCAAILFFLFWS